MAEGRPLDFESDKGESREEENMAGEHPIARMLKEAGEASGAEDSIDWLHEKNKR
jgi:hypothetical protein